MKTFTDIINVVIAIDIVVVVMVIVMLIDTILLVLCIVSRGRTKPYWPYYIGLNSDADYSFGRRAEGLGFQV